MQGALVDDSPTDLCLRLAGEAASGVLSLSSPAGTAELTFARGRLVGARAPSTSSGRGGRIGERLVLAGRLREADLQRTLAEQAGVPLGQLLVDRGLVGPDAVRVLLQEQLFDALAEVVGWGVGSWDLVRSDVPPGGVGVDVPVDRALREAVRRVREHGRITELVPSTAAVVARTARPAPAGLSHEATAVLAASDGTRSVRLIATTLGFAESETSRLLYQLALQGLVVAADTSGGTRDGQETDLHASTTSAPDQPAADQGWATRRAGSTIDEPEPWVGWAHAPASTQPAPAPEADGPRAEPWMPSTPQVASPPPRARREHPVDEPVEEPIPAPAPPLFEAPAPAPRQPLDADTRRALFSELHGLGLSGEPAAPATVPEAAPDPEPEVEPDAPEDAVVPPTAPPPMSRDDVSDLLRELHDLGLGDDPADDAPAPRAQGPATGSPEADRRRNRFGRGQPS